MRSPDLAAGSKPRAASRQQAVSIRGRGVVTSPLAVRLNPGSPVRILRSGKELQGRYSSLVLTLRVDPLASVKSGPAQHSRGFCFDPVRRIGSNWFEDSPSR